MGNFLIFFLLLFCPGVCRASRACSCRSSAGLGGSTCPAVIGRLVRAAHPCSSACCQRGEGNLCVSRSQRSFVSSPWHRRSTGTQRRILSIGVPKCGLLAPASGRWLCRAPILSTPMRRLWSPGSFHDLPSPLQWACAFCFVLCCMIFSATRGMSVALLLDSRSTVLSSALAFTAVICRDAALITSDETRTLRKLFCSLG